MATLALCIIKSRPKEDGTFAIKIRITNGTSTNYITTQYCVDKTQWNGGQVIRHPQATMINAKLFQLINKYQARLDALDPGKNMTASEIKELLEKGDLVVETVADFAEAYIERLKENKQTAYAKNMEYTRASLIDCFGASMRLKDFTPTALKLYEKFLFEQGGAKKKNNSERSKTASPTTVNIRMTHLKALLNAAVNEGMVEYKIFPFRNYKMPAKNVRDICISKEELARLRDCDPSKFPKAKCANKDSTRRLTVARDLFLLSFYCAGINLTDLMSARLDGDVLTFIRKKTADKKMGADKEVSLTIQPEARAIIDKYINERGELNMGYKFKDYEQFRSFVTKSLNRIGEELEFEKRLTYYSARKTFVQFGSELGIPLYILEYAIGQTIKEANNRPVFNYLKIMRSQADLAIRTIIDYSFEPTNEDEMPLPEWARRR